jgi:hypothetical protein
MAEIKDENSAKAGRLRRTQKKSTARETAASINEATRPELQAARRSHKKANLGESPKAKTTVKERKALIADGELLATEPVGSPARAQRQPPKNSKVTKKKVTKAQPPAGQGMGQSGENSEAILHSQLCLEDTQGMRGRMKSDSAIDAYGYAPERSTGMDDQLEVEPSCFAPERGVGMNGRTAAEVEPSNAVTSPVMAQTMPVPAAAKLPEANELPGNLAPPGRPTITTSVRVESVDSAQLPLAAVKVRNVVGEVVDLVTELIPGKVIVQGMIHEQLFFVGTDGLIHHLADAVPFSTFVDLPGVQPGMNAHVTAAIEKILPELAPDGLSVIKKIIIEIFVKVTETIQVGLQPGTGPLILLQQVVGEGTAQTLVENDLTLAVPALKIDEVVGKVQGLTTEVIADKVIIQGILHQQIFLVGADNLGRHQAEEVPFSAFVDLPGAAPGMAVQVQPRLETLLFELITPTMLRQKAIIEFFVKVTEATRANVTPGAGPLFKVAAWVNENTVQDLSETVVTLPVAAVKIREIIAQVREIATQVIVNKVIVQGILHKQVFFIDTDNVERHQAEETPFAVFLDLPGAIPGDQVEITPEVEGIFFVLETPTQLQQRLIIAITAVVSRAEQLNLALGTEPLYVMEQVVNEGTKQVLVVRREAIVPPPPPPVTPTIVNEVIIIDPGKMVEAGQQIVLRNQVALPVTALSVKEVNGTIVDQRYWVIPTGVIVEGAVVKDVAFVGVDHVVRRITERVPFSIMVPVPGIDPNLPAEVNLLIEDISFELDPTGERVNQTIVLQATVGEQSPATTATVVTDVTGPGVVQTKIRVVELVLLPDGQTERREFDVVTAVTGIGIVGTEQAVVLLNVIENGTVNRKPVEVVIKVILAA